MGNENFIKELKYGNRVEKVVAYEYFVDVLGAEILSFNNDKKHDFNAKLTDGLVLTVEVKGDKWCIPPRTIKTPFGLLHEKGRDKGNMFIETESWGNKGGIEATKSDIFVYYFTLLKKAWIIKTENLKKLIKNNKFELKTEYVGDENSETKGYVIPREEFRKHFRVIDIKKTWE